MPSSRSNTKWILSTAVLVFALTSTRPAAADWLITLGGHLIETEGPWTVEGQTLTYTDTEGVARSLALSEIDLEASEETTALREGRPYVPKKRVAEARPQVAAAGSADGAEDESKITVYVTSWCGYCRKAQKLLKELGADFEAKDIEKSQEAAREYRAKSGGRGGVPLIDFDGTLVRGYSERTIRQQVRKIQEAG